MTAINAVAESKKFLLEQYKHSRLLTGLLNSILKQIDDLSTCVEDLTNKCNIKHGVGQQLDLIGYFLNEDRKYRSDENYRTALYIKIFINSAHATCDDILTILELVYQPDFIHLKEPYPAYFTLFVFNPKSFKGIYALIKNIKPAGVGFSIILNQKQFEYFRFNISTVVSMDYYINKDEDLRDLDENDNHLSILSGQVLNKGGFFSILLYTLLPRLINQSDDYFINQDGDGQLFFNPEPNDIINKVKFAYYLYDT
jgi:hypothetical protein